MRRNLKQVEEFSERSRWDNVSNIDTDQINESLAHLPNNLPKEDELVKRFDLLCFKLQLAILKSTNDYTSLWDKLGDLLDCLEEKNSIPMVKQQLPFIQEVWDVSWWADVTPSRIESVRLRLRHLIKFIDRPQQSIIYTDFKNEMGEVEGTGF